MCGRVEFPLSVRLVSAPCLKPDSICVGRGASSEDENAKQSKAHQLKERTQRSDASLLSSCACGQMVEIVRQRSTEESVLSAVWSFTLETQKRLPLLADASSGLLLPRVLAAFFRAAMCVVPLSSYPACVLFHALCCPTPFPSQQFGFMADIVFLVLDWLCTCEGRLGVFCSENPPVNAHVCG